MAAHWNGAPILGFSNVRRPADSSKMKHVSVGLVGCLIFVLSNALTVQLLTIAAVAEFGFQGLLSVQLISNLPAMAAALPMNRSEFLR